MCSFIILLLLLCKNNGNCGCNRSCNAGEHEHSHECGRRDDDHHRRDRDDNWRRDDDNDYRRDNDRDCGCSACEDGGLADESPIVEREDIWTSYKNTSAGKQSK